MGSIPDAVSEGPSKTFYRIDTDERVHPMDSRRAWETWMTDSGRHLRVLISAIGPVKVGIKFLGTEHGWDQKSGNPNLWLAAVLVNKKVITTLHVDSFDTAVKKVHKGLESVLSGAPTRWNRLCMKTLIWKLRFRQKGLKKHIFRKIQE